MYIYINDLTFKCIIGILPKERIKKQKVIVNLSFKYIYTKDDFIDYSKITAFITKTMKKKKFLLIEDALIYIEKKLKKSYKIDKLKLKITKPDILNNCQVSVLKK
jgi:dihydroneopterin aldolase